MSGNQDSKTTERTPIRYTDDAVCLLLVVTGIVGNLANGYAGIGQIPAWAFGAGILYGLAKKPSKAIKDIVTSNVAQTGGEGGQ